MSGQCVNCNGDTSRIPSLPRVAALEHELRLCTSCGFVFLSGGGESLHDRPPNADGAPPVRRSRLARLRLRPVLRTIERWCDRSGGRALDAGCGLGDLAALLADDGWEAWGCDPAEDAAHACRPELGGRFAQAEVVDADLPDGTFDLVVMNFSLEHMPRPREAVQRVARLLRPGGVAVIRVPNFEAALQGRRGAVFQLRLPHHCSFFTARSLARLLEAAGLEILEVSTPASLQEGMSVVCEVVPALDPEQWMFGPRSGAGIARAAALALVTAGVQPWTRRRCRKGNGLVLHAAARRPRAA